MEKKNFLEWQNYFFQVLCDTHSDHNGYKHSRMTEKKFVINI